MSDKNWKKQERRVAKMCGTTRTPLSGKMSKAGTSSDSLHPRLYVEAKYRETIAVIEWFMKIVPKAVKEKKIPMLTLKAKNRKADLIVIRLKDFVDIAKIISKGNVG